MTPARRRTRPTSSTPSSSLNRLAVSVRKQQGSIDQALERAAQRADVARQAARRPGAGCCRRWTSLGGVGVRVIKASKDVHHRQTSASSHPVLTELANAGDDFAKSLQRLPDLPVRRRGRRVATRRSPATCTWVTTPTCRSSWTSRSATTRGPPTALPTDLPTVIDPHGGPRTTSPKCLRSGDLDQQGLQEGPATPPQKLLKLKEECRKKKNERTKASARRSTSSPTSPAACPARPAAVRRRWRSARRASPCRAPARRVRRPPAIRRRTGRARRPDDGTAA